MPLLFSWSAPSAGGGEQESSPRGKVDGFLGRQKTTRILKGTQASAFMPAKVWNA